MSKLKLGTFNTVIMDEDNMKTMMRMEAMKTVIMKTSTSIDDGE